MAAASRRVVGTPVGVRTTEPVVALTFDDGPDPVSTPRLINILDRYEAKATFFVVGRQAEQHRAILDALVAREHQIGNHTHDHVQMPSLHPTERIEQLENCERILGEYSSGYFRPPKGLQTYASRRDVLNCGLTPVTWNAHIEDWAVHHADFFANQLQQKVVRGSVVLLHDRIDDPVSDAVRDRSEMLLGLEAFLSRNHERFRFVTLSDLFNYGRIRRANWFIRNEKEWPTAVRYL